MTFRPTRNFYTHLVKIFFCCAIFENNFLLLAMFSEQFSKLSDLHDSVANSQLLWMIHENFVLIILNLKAEPTTLAIRRI